MRAPGAQRLDETLTGRTRVLSVLMWSDPGQELFLESALREGGLMNVLVQSTPDLDQTLAALRTTTPEVLLLTADVEPSVVRQLASWSTRTAILLLGPDMTELATEEAIRAGAQDCVPWPATTPHDLVRAIRFALARKRVEERTLRLGRHDPLTGLANRDLLLERTRGSIARCTRQSGYSALLYIDMDRFRPVNDTYGSEVGDRILVRLAERFVGCVREVDTVARIAGDEFAVLLDGIETPEGAGTVAARIIDALEPPFVLGPHQFSLSASVGIAIAPTDTLEADALVKFADSAMCRAKRAGRGGFRFYNAQIDTKGLELGSLELALRHALSAEEFVLHYQPQIDLKSGNVRGLEALVRWERPGHGLVPPGKFIPLLESTGLIGPVGEWVLREACRQLRAWQRMGVPPVVVAVNISAIQLRQPGFAQLIFDVVKETGIDPENLEIELTESAFIEAGAETTAALKSLRDRGIGLSIDDFGTGYSALSSLTQLPADVVKLDRSLVHNVTRSSDAATVATAIVGMLKALGRTVVAEGVETLEQLSFVRSRRCDMVQGFLFAQAMPAADIPTLLGSEVPLRDAC